MSTIDLRDRTISSVWDLLGVARDAFARTGLVRHDVLVTQDQHDTIYALIAAFQGITIPEGTAGNPVTWNAMTIRVAA